MNELDKLPSRQKDVILRRLGIKNGQAETLQEIGNCYGVSRERIRQLEFMALSTLRERVPNFDQKMKAVRFWQTAANVRAAAEAAGIKYSKIINCAVSLRAAGIPLKSHPRGTGIKPLSDKHRAAVDPGFKKRRDRKMAFVSDWNEGQSTLVLAKKYGLGSRGSVGAYSAHLRRAGYPIVPRGINPMQKLSAEEFVRMWQSCDNMKEMVKKSGMNYVAIQARKNNLKKLGVPLKIYRHYKQMSPEYVEKLKQIANESVA